VDPRESADARGRLVLVTPGFNEVGGAARRSALLARGLAARGWDVRVVTRAGTGRRPTVTRSDRLLAVEIPGFGAGRLGALPFLVVGLPLAVVWGLRARAFLAVQLMSTATVAGLAATLTGRPWVASSTTSGELGETQYLLTRRTALLRHRLFDGVARLVAQTDGAAVELCQLVPADRITVIPNPVVLPDPVPPLTGSRSALFTGRFSVEKDLPRLLVAWRPLAAADPALRLVLAGAGGAYRSVEDEVRQAVSADPVLDGCVSLPGWVQDVAPLLRTHDVYVFASLSEGMSNSLLEACAAGRVVVASAIGPNVSVVGEDYPLLFPPGDTVALREALRRALYDDGARAAAVAHLAARMPTMSVDSVLDQVEEVLLDAADRSRHQLA
jgi:glycosyltransferase involved in cell wall biosynthesis